MQEKQKIAKDLAALVDEFLCYLWDPLQISVENLPYTRNEYSSYVSRICDAVTSGSTEKHLTGLLDNMITKEISADPSKCKSKEVSALIMKCYRYLLDEPEMGHNMLTYYKKAWN